MRHRQRLHSADILAGSINTDQPILADLIAFHTFSGVAGMSMWRTPKPSSASQIALIVAAGPAMAAASPQPFAPTGFVLHNVSSELEFDIGHCGGTGHCVIHERAGEQLPVFFIVAALFQQGLPDRLCRATVNLAFDDHRIDDPAEIVDRHIPFDRHMAGIDIDFDFDQVTAIGKR